MRRTLYLGAACGSGSFSHDGSTPQISRAYSEIVRSLENFPLDAMLWIAISNHLAWFWKRKGEEMLGEFTNIVRTRFFKTEF